MPISTGPRKFLLRKTEVTWGIAPGASGAQYMRRVSSDISLNKATYGSREIRPDLQRSDFRHGVRSVGGSINGELSPLTWQGELQAALRGTFAGVTAINSLTLSTTAPSGVTQTLVRSAGDWLADGVKVGMVVRATAGLTANSLNVNLFVVAAVALTLTVEILNGSVLATQTSIAACTVTIPGKKLSVPLTGHTDNSIAYEHWHADIAQSELFLGCKIDQVEISLPPTGMATFKASVVGKDVTLGTAQYFATAPAAATTTGALAAVNGALVANGIVVALVTGMSFVVKGNMTTDPVVGQNTVPSVNPGMIDLSGQLTVLFQDAVFRDYFINETEVALAVCLTTGNAGTADFMSFAFPRIKIGGAAKTDGEKSIVMTMPFTALLALNGGAAYDHDQTTLTIQDSAAV